MIGKVNAKGAWLACALLVCASSCGEPKHIKQTRTEIAAYTAYAEERESDLNLNIESLKSDEPRASGLFYEVQDSISAKTLRIQQSFAKIAPTEPAYKELLTSWLNADLRLLAHQRDLRIIGLRQQRNDLRAQLEFLSPDDFTPEMAELNEKLERYDEKIESVREQYEGRMEDLKNNPEFLLN